MNGLYFVGAERNNIFSLYSKRENGWVFKRKNDLGTEEEPFTLMDKATALSTVKEIQDIVGDNMRVFIVSYETAQSFNMC